MATLQRAVTITHVDHVAAAISQHLHLNVPGVYQVLLDVEAVTAERGLGFRLRDRVEAGQLSFTGDGPDTAAAPAAHRFDHDGIANLGRRIGRRGQVRREALGPR